MGQSLPENSSEVVAQLGEPKLVCRTSRKTLFWGFLLASLLSGVGIAVLITVLRDLLADWSKDVFNTIALLTVATLLLWGGWALWRRTNCKRRVWVIVQTGGLSYYDGKCVLTCRWDQVAEVQWRVANHYDDTERRKHSHTSHDVALLRRDGVQLVFTEELQNIVSLAKAIQQETGRNIGERVEEHMTSDPKLRNTRESLPSMTEEELESPREVRLRGLFQIGIGALLSPVFVILSYFLMVLVGWRNHALIRSAAMIGAIPVLVVLVGWLELVTGVSFRRLERIFKGGGLDALGLFLLVVASVAAFLVALFYIADLAVAHGWL